MTTTTRFPIRERRRRGFTLTELLVAVGLSGLVLGAILAAFLFLARTGLRLEFYNDMEHQARTALEVFARDTREASAITWNSAHSVTLTVAATPITYAHADGRFSRTTTAGTKVLITGITAFSFKGYSVPGAELPPVGDATSRTNASRLTKQLQISLQSSRAQPGTATATHKVLSARYILRNKRVTT
jgi:prepilin-type N-terminal cleavage/methylation domain-containing protein